jgi:hypothetical protein
MKRFFRDHLGTIVIVVMVVIAAGWGLPPIINAAKSVMTIKMSPEIEKNIAMIKTLKTGDLVVLKTGDVYVIFLNDKDRNSRFVDLLSGAGKFYSIRTISLAIKFKDSISQTEESKYFLALKRAIHQDQLPPAFN